MAELWFQDENLMESQHLHFLEALRRSTVEGDQAGAEANCIFKLTPKQTQLKAPWTKEWERHSWAGSDPQNCFPIIHSVTPGQAQSETAETLCYPQKAVTHFRLVIKPKKSFLLQIWS